ncbi:MAG: hypothetical protein F6K22_22220 [Okeania sp. SIO2F4]|uniref:hypothetical protein n=1 Tax=Okeania sp. SIO2F4 TaxID=2607790 RepID=UPI001428F104|nr:hypothetical protein [Okeania sp. SIO2F4]NES05296.1 hypothetical protein [Okeania sp. SIO2F4]
MNIFAKFRSISSRGFSRDGRIFLTKREWNLAKFLPLIEIGKLSPMVVGKPWIFLPNFGV